MRWLFVALLVAVSSATICENSPYNVAQMQGIMAAALKNLSNIWQWPPALIPNLVKGTNSAKDCDPSKKQISNCGYPSAFITSTGSTGAVEESWRFLQNPDIGYIGALINQTKILNPTDPIHLSDVATQMDFGEAIIYFGCTPQVTYYGYSKLLWAMNPPLDSAANQLLGSLGDSLNHLRLKTNRVDTTKSGGGSTLIVYTASEQTYSRIRDTFAYHGFNVAGINVDPLPTNLIELGAKGAFLGFGSRNSNLTLAETSYLFAAGGYFQLNQLSFPYVRLTPAFGAESYFCKNSISPLPVWIPIVDTPASVPSKAIMAASEHAYEPRLLGALQAIMTVIKTELTTQTGTVLKWTAYPQTATFLDEFGEKHIFSHAYLQHGGAGTRDNAYFNYHPGVIPIYGSLNFSIVVGLRHERAASWAPVGKPKGHATFWNIAYSDQTNTGALMRFNNFDPNCLNYQSLLTLGGSVANDPLNAIFVRVTGVTTHTNAAIKGVLAKYFGTAVPLDNDIEAKAPMGVLHHAYVNPDTGVAPWQGSVIAPMQIHFIGVPV